MASVGIQRRLVDNPDSPSNGTNGPAMDGLRIDPVFCPEGVADPFDTTEWELRSAVIKDEQGAVTELRCTYHPETLGGAPLAEGGKVKGIVHWVDAREAIEATVNLYDHLFRTTDPEEVSEGGHWHDNLNPDSLEVLSACRLEPTLAAAKPGERFQFERLGYFCLDSEDSKPGALVFNRTATLRDTWAKLEARS